MIAIHALKTLGGGGGPRTQAVYMQLDLADGGPDDETFDTVELTLVPPPPPPPPAAGQQSEASRLFDAISACADLHPDPVSQGDDDDDDDDDDRIVWEGEGFPGAAGPEALEGFGGVYRGAADGGLPPPLPGSSGWITADNVHEYFDADGNWIGDGEDGGGGALGEGAGRVRAREEVDADAVNGHEADNDAENKRPRVD